MLSGVRQRLDDVVKDPLGLFLDLLFSWAQPFANLDLEPLRDVFLDNLEVLGGPEEVVDVLGHELVLEGLGRVHLGLLVLVGCRRLTSFLEYLLLDLPFAVEVLALHDGAIDLLLLLEV